MKWRIEDIEFLKINYKTMPTEEIQAKLVDSRSLGSIRSKAKKLGLSKVTRVTWTLKENLIVCKIYLEEKIIGSRSEYINAKLVAAGFVERTSNSVNAKYYNFKFLDTGNGYKSYSKDAQKAFQMLTGRPGHPKD